MDIDIEKAAPIYQKAINEAGYSYKLKFYKKKQKEKKTKKMDKINAKEWETLHGSTLHIQWMCQRI